MAQIRFGASALLRLLVQIRRTGKGRDLVKKDQIQDQSFEMALLVVLSRRTGFSERLPDHAGKFAFRRNESFPRTSHSETKGRDSKTWDRQLWRSLVFGLGQIGFAHNPIRVGPYYKPGSR